MRRINLGIIAGLAALPLCAQDLQELAKKITEFTLPNGLHFILVERREAPVITFLTSVRAGSVDDPGGQTGMAHLLEHMAFKGTENIGTRDWAAEKKALDAAEEAYDRLEAERNQTKPDVGKVGAAEIMLKRAIEQAQVLAKPGEFRRIIEENGGVGLKAVAIADETEYSYSLPSNRIELWFMLESQRLQRPVFRDFYRERDVVAEEYRERVDSNVQGKLTHALLATALAVHPYRNPGQGWPSHAANLRRSQAKEFFDRYYVPGNITIAIAGDVDPAEAKRLADRYFAAMPARPMPPRVRAQDPPQSGPRTVVVESPQQMAMVAYKRPDQFDRDDATLDVIQFILTGGRTGWLHKELVLGKKIALGAQSVPTFPGGRYPGLFAILVAPSAGHTLEENQAAVDAILSRLTNERVDAVTLDRAKTKIRATVVQLLGDNAGLATLLAKYHSGFGSWRTLFTNIDDLQKVTADDVLRASRQYFTAANRTLAITAPPPQRMIAAPARGRR